MAHTPGTKYETEFAGGFRTVTVLVDAGTQTGTVQFTSLKTIRGVSCMLAEAPTAAAALLMATVGTGANSNVVTVREYTPQGTLNTQTALDFYLIAVGEY